MGTHALRNIFLKILNNSTFSGIDNHFWLKNLPQSNDFCSDMKSIIDIWKRFSYNPLIGYINVNSLKQNVSLLMEVFLNVPRYSFRIWNILHDEIKLDLSSSDHQFNIEGHRFLLFKRDRNWRGRKLV